MNIFETICLVAAITYILCDTSALEQYLKVILGIFKMNSEVVNPKLDMGLPLISRLRLKYTKGISAFFVNLLECPICLSVWLSVFFGVLKFGYETDRLAVVVVGSWWAYLSTRILVKASNK
jgi:hypothetical protein